MVNYYKILELQNYASVSEVKSAYKRLVKLYHPDIYAGPDGEEITKYLNQAKDALNTEEKKQRYDIQLQLAYSYELKQNKRKPKPTYWQTLTFEERKRRKEEARKLQIKDEYLAGIKRFPKSLRWIGIGMLLIVGLQLVYKHYFVMYNGYDLFYIILGLVTFTTGIAIGANEAYTYFTVKSIDHALKFNYEKTIAWVFVLALFLGPIGIRGINEARKNYLLKNNADYYWADINLELSKLTFIVYSYEIGGVVYQKSRNVDQTLLFRAGKERVLIKYALPDPRISDVIFASEIPDLPREL